MGTDLFGTASGSDASRPEARFADPLTVAGVKPGENGAIAIDDYVRFTFDSPAGTAGTGTVAIEDGEGGLAEIAIDLATGRLRSATLVIFAGRAGALRFAAEALPMTEGLPVLDLPDFGSDDLVPRSVRKGAIALWRGPKIGLVQIADGAPDRLIRTRDALFAVAGDTLWGFGADGLDREHLSRMTG